MKLGFLKTALWNGIVVFTPKMMYSLNALFILLISVFLVGRLNINMTFWSIYLCAFYVCALCWRIVARIILKHYRSKGNNYRRVIILGAGTMAKELQETISAIISEV